MTKFFDLRGTLLTLKIFLWLVGIIFVLLIFLSLFLYLGDFLGGRSTGKFAI